VGRHEASGPAGADETVTVEGTVDRVVFRNPESAWTVLRVAAPDRAEPITAVGGLLGIEEGESLRLTGRWIVDKKYGLQLKVESYLTLSPSTLVGIERYLGSGLIEGIGKAMAERLVKRFGLETLQVIEERPERLTEVEGIGPVRAARIKEAWAEQREIKAVMIFLQAHEVSAAYAIRIFKRYGGRAIAVVRENPYRLALEIPGIGFKIADRIARKLGLDPRSPARAEAGLLHALGASAEEGHVHLPEQQLLQRAADLLELDEPRLLEEALAALVEARQVAREEVPAGERGAAAEAYVSVALVRLRDAEADAAARLMALVRASARPIVIDPKRAVEWFEEARGLTLAAEQRHAIERACLAKLLVITGGPGTGKTTIVNGIIRILEKKQRRILLAAPTGRAAKRMSEATEREAKTLHRLLEFDPKQGGFARTEDHPLEADVVIVDEVSMLDTLLLESLVRALPRHAQLVLVGDVDQLPSVGPGQVLKDVIESGRAEVVRLERIFRQAEESLIVVNAHRINRGELPQRAALPGGRQDFFVIERDTPEETLATLKMVVERRIPDSFGLDPRSEVQVLTPMHRGLVGAGNLNQQLQALLNPSGPSLARGTTELRVGDKVMQLRNNYDLGVFNGDVGFVAEVDAEARSLVVRYDERLVVYDRSALDELTLAYACSIHKSQGSEYPAVVVPITTQHFVMLHKNLLYTAVTRGKRLVVLVGSARALALAVKNRREDTRFTRLAARLASG
jgi:exodeoxyribonuclease V alpha subunit